MSATVKVHVDRVNVAPARASDHDASGYFLRGRYELRVTFKVGTATAQQLIAEMAASDYGTTSIDMLPGSFLGISRNIREAS